jgi:hypothetical protein
MKRIVAASALCVLSLGAAAQGQVNIICSVQAEWCNMISTVYARTTGVKVNVSLKGSGEALAQHLRQPLVILGLRQVQPQEVQQPGEPVELLRRRPLGQLDLVEAGADQVAVLGVAEVVARDADDAAAARQAAMAKRLEQRRHQFAPCQIASAAEEDEVKTHFGDCNLVSSLEPNARGLGVNTMTGVSPMPDEQLPSLCWNSVTRETS